jgi:phytoene dehydrogenase-like protein
LVAIVGAAGGRVETDVRVESMHEVPDARAVLFDVNPAQLARIAGTRLPSRYLDRLRRFRQGAGVCKIDFLLDGPVPWADDASRRAPTVHVGGTMAQCANAEAEVAAGGHPAAPFVLAVQADVIDSSRTPAGRHLLWAYTHVPNGSTVDMTEQIERQIERFAPGFRDRILRRWVTTPTQFEDENPNLVGGDITGGSNGGLQLFVRPRALRPYDTPDPGIFLCSASTPPGGGVHGMNGHLAAERALATVLRD